MKESAASDDRSATEPLILELMNTVWLEKGLVRDALASPDAGAQWLVAARRRLRLPDVPSTDDGVTGLRDLRTALRRVAARITDDPRDEKPVPDFRAAVATINRTSAAAPRVAALVDGAGDLSVEERLLGPADDADAVVLAIIAEQGIRFFASPQRALLRPCLGPGCLFYFQRLDARRVWCSAHCGNRARVTRHYYRHRD